MVMGEESPRVGSLLGIPNQPLKPSPWTPNRLKIRIYKSFAPLRVALPCNTSRVFRYFGTRSLEVDIYIKIGQKVDAH